MASAGRILIMPKGEYNPGTTYEMLDLVEYGGTSWLAKKTVVGITPSDETNEYWQKMFSTPIKRLIQITPNTDKFSYDGFDFLTSETTVFGNIIGVSDVFITGINIFEDGLIEVKLNQTANETLDILLTFIV